MQLPNPFATEIQNFDHLLVSTFLSEYWHNCFDKQTTGKIFSVGELIVKTAWKKHASLESYYAFGASLDKSWSFLVPGKATKSFFFE